MALSEQAVSRSLEDSAGDDMLARELALTTHTTELSFDRLREEWTELLAHSEADSIFLSWDWSRAWWSAFNGRHSLYLVEARTPEGLLVAIAPLKARKRIIGKPIVEFLSQGGGVTPEYLDFIVRSGWREAAIPAIVRHVISDATVGGVCLCGISSDSPNLDLVKTALRSVGWVREKEVSRCPVMDLPKSWSEFVLSKSKNYRKKIREYENRCSRELSVTFRRSRTEAELEADLESLKRLHRMRWGSKSRTFEDRRNFAFHEDIARRLLAKDSLRLYVMEDGGRPVYVLYCFCHGATVYYYQSGRDPSYSSYRVGLLAIHWAIRDAISERRQVFDFLTGTESYKQRWATRCVQNVSLKWEQPGTVRHALACLLSIRERVSSLR